VANGEESCDPERHASGDGIHIHPKGDPRNENHQNGRQVALDEVETKGSGQVECRHDATVVSYEIEEPKFRSQLRRKANLRLSASF